MYHRIGSLLPQSTVEPPLFAQIYIFDTDNEIQNRLNIMPSLNQVTLAALQNMLHDINPYVQVFQQTGRLFQQNSQKLTMIITDSQCYNVPTTSEIAAIIVGDNNNPSNVSNRDIILHLHEGGLQHISELHRAYAPLHYVLLFPRGEDGWHPTIPIQNEAQPYLLDAEEQHEIDEDSIKPQRHEIIIMMKYYAYQLQVGRPGEGMNLYLSGHLSNNILLMHICKCGTKLPKLFEV